MNLLVRLLGRAIHPHRHLPYPARRDRMPNIITWTGIVVAVIAITLAWFVANGLPPKDYLVLFGFIATALGVIILVNKR